MHQPTVTAASVSTEQRAGKPLSPQGCLPSPPCPTPVAPLGKAARATPALLSLSQYWEMPLLLLQPQRFDPSDEMSWAKEVEDCLL